MKKYTKLNFDKFEIKLLEITIGKGNFEIDYDINLFGYEIKG